MSLPIATRSESHRVAAKGNGVTHLDLLGVRRKSATTVTRESSLDLLLLGAKAAGALKVRLRQFRICPYDARGSRLPPKLFAKYVPVCVAASHFHNSLPIAGVTRTA